MSNTSTFMAAGAGANDPQLAELIRASFLAQPERSRLEWLSQIELGLDGYGERHRDTAARILDVLRLLAREHSGAAPQAANLNAAQ